MFPHWVVLLSRPSIRNPYLSKIRLFLCSIRYLGVLYFLYGSRGRGGKGTFLYWPIGIQAILIYMTKLAVSL
jgi:hypothetical protein